jgi:hypothetical protein
MDIEGPTVSVNQPNSSTSDSTTATSCRPTIEDVPDDGGDSTSTDWKHYIQEFDAAFQAGVAMGEGRTKFEKIWEEQNDKQSVWAGFGDKAKWEFAKFMIKTLGHNNMEKLLRLDLVRS